MPAQLPNAFRLLISACLLLLLSISTALAQARITDYKPLPSYNQLTDNWQVRTDDGKLEPYVPGWQFRPQALHQFVTVKSWQPFQVKFRANPGLSIWLDNRLVFQADTVGVYELNFGQWIKKSEKTYQALVSIWQPNGFPAFELAAGEKNPALITAATSATIIQMKPQSNRGLYVISLLIIGLGYGLLRAYFPASFLQLLQPVQFNKLGSSDSAFGERNLTSWPDILFLVLFGLSLALVTVLVQRNLQDLVLLKGWLPQPKGSILISVLIGSLVVIGAVAMKRLYLKLVAYIFDFSSLVELQYREFVRASLFFGLGLPVLLLLYLAVGQAERAPVAQLVNWVIILLLVFPVLRIGFILGTKYTLRDLQLLSYFCATEILPLAIILKIVFLSY